MAKECKTFFNQIASLLSDKPDTPYKCNISLGTDKIIIFFIEIHQHVYASRNWGKHKEAGDIALHVAKLICKQEAEEA